MKCLADIMAPWLFLESSTIDHDWHWHRFLPGHDGWASVYCDEEPWGEWTVESYPHEGGDKDIRGRRFETREEAAEYVAATMEVFDEQFA
jgi:hypothetical protein